MVIRGSRAVYNLAKRGAAGLWRGVRELFTFRVLLGVCGLASLWYGLSLWSEALAWTVFGVLLLTTVVVAELRGW